MDTREGNAYCKEYHYRASGTIIVFVSAYFFVCMIRTELRDVRERRPSLVGEIREVRNCLGENGPMASGGLYLCPENVDGNRTNLFDEVFPANLEVLGLKVQHPDLYAAAEARKVIFCYIPKNGSSKMKRLFLRANGENWNITDAEAHGKYFLSKKVHGKDMKEESKMEALSSSQWIRSVMLRDPIERFISAYLHRIVANRALQGNSLDVLLDDEQIRKYVNMSFQATGESLLEFLKLEFYFSRDNHFKLQKKFCGFDDLPKNFYNRVAIYSRNVDLDDLISSIFDHRMDHEIYDGWPEGESLWGKSTLHTTVGSNNFLSVMESVCNNITVYKRVMEYVRPDYEFFNFLESRSCDSHILPT